MQRARSLVTLILALALLPGAALAGKPSDAHALEGVTSGKIAWDINMADAKKMRLYLQVIEETYGDLERQGVAPDMILTFRGPSVRLITTDHSQVPAEQKAHHEAVAEQLEILMAKPDVRVEACSVATRLTGVDAADLLPGIEHVGNTFVSQIGYQAKGYAIIPIM
jgi:intracellular sulfur oxidation DsrE/DsrF family protein